MQRDQMILPSGLRLATHTELVQAVARYVAIEAALAL